MADVTNLLINGTTYNIKDAVARNAMSGPLVASTKSAMTNTSKVYVYTGSESGMTNGNWYYHNGSAWVSGGVYNSTALTTDKTLTVSDMAADAKVVGDKFTSLNALFTKVITNTNSWELGNISWRDGTNTNASNRIRMKEYVSLNDGVITIKVQSGYEFSVYIWNEATGVFIGLVTDSQGSTSWLTEFTLEDGNKYRIVMRNATTPSSDMAVTESSNCIYIVCKTDSTLTKTNMPADAKVVGDKFDFVNSLMTKEIPNTNSWELGNISYIDGSNTNASNRIRMKEYVSLNDGVITIKVQTGYEFSVYIWNEATGAFVGLVTDSQGLNLWLNEFTLESGFKYRIVMRNATTPSSDMAVTDNSKCTYIVYRTDDTLSKVGLPADAKVVGDELTVLNSLTTKEIPNTNSWELGNISYIDGSNTNASNRIRMKEYVNLNDGVITIKVQTGYEFSVYIWNESTGAFVGLVSDSQGLNLWLNEFTLESGFKYRIVMRNATTPSSDMAVTDNSKCTYIVYRMYGSSHTFETEYKFLGMPIMYLDHPNITDLRTKEDGSISGVNCTIPTLNISDSSVKIKVQGASSQAYPKKNYTITFSGNVVCDETWGSHKKYVIKADWVDFSQMRNEICAKIWGQVRKTRSTYPDGVNAGAIDAFPILLVINGEYWGLYSLSIPKDDWMVGMDGSNVHEAIVAAENHSLPTQFKGLITSIDEDGYMYDANNNKSFGMEYVTDETDMSWLVSSLNTLITAVMQTEGDLIAAITPYVDIESAIDYYIFSCIVNNTDGTDKNFLLDTWDGVKWTFVAYDMDGTFGNTWDGKSYTAANSGCTFAAYASISRLMNIIYTYNTAALKARYTSLRQSVLSDIQLTNTIMNYAVGIKKAAFDYEALRWPTRPGTNTNNWQQILDYLRLRLSYLDAEIEAL